MSSDIKFFSKCFINECGKHKMKFASNFSNINVYFLVKYINADTLKEWINNEKLVKNSNFNDIFKLVKFKLINVNESSFNKDNLEESEHTYQELRQESVLPYIFSGPRHRGYMYDNSKYSIIRNSVDYNTAQTYYNMIDSDNRSNITVDDNTNEDKSVQKSKYLALLNQYNINYDESHVRKGEYDSSEFFRLKVDEDTIIESETVVKCDDFQYFEPDASESKLSKGVYGFLLTYAKDESTEVPMMVYEFAKPVFSNYNKIRLVFNANGLFGVT